MMETLTLISVTASNIFGIVPIISLIATKRYYGVGLVTSAVVGSIFMHATETKHKLPGLFLAEYSNIFLNIDRVVAYCTGLYGLYLFYTNPTKTITQIITPLIGGALAFAGEQTENLSLYTICHIGWHLLAYIALNLVNH